MIFPLRGSAGLLQQTSKPQVRRRLCYKTHCACQKLADGTVEYAVKPMNIEFPHPLAGVNAEFNAVFVKGNAVGELMFYGPGAEPLPTGSAVMGDVLEISKAILR